MVCCLCKRDGEDHFFEKHHLTPQDRKDSDVIIVCHQCGDQIHLLFDNTMLKKDLSDLYSIVTNERFAKYLHWVRKKPLEKHFSVKRKKRK